MGGKMVSATGKAPAPKSVTFFIRPAKQAYY
jgi:hypothetical protein